MCACVLAILASADQLMELGSALVWIKKFFRVVTLVQ